MSQRGFTLVELCITIVLIGILFASSSLILSSGLNSYSTIHSRGTNAQQTRYAMERMVREIRNTPNTLQSITGSQVAFIDSQDLTATFTFDNVNSQLLRDSDVLLENVNGISFTGYDEDGNVTNTAANVWRLHVDLETLPEGEDSPMNLSTDIFMRNLMYENFR